MTDKKAFEQFVHEFTGRDIEWHKQAGTWGVDENSFAYACWKKSWNAAIDAAISKCEEVRKDNAYCDSEYGAIFCKEEIQKLRSE